MAASFIEDIYIQNFKFFPKLNEPIKLEGKHWLLFGENGSGKSSIYWALYTLLECSNKENIEQIKKYFSHDELEKERLINIHLKHGTPNWVDSYVKIKLKDGTEFNVSFTDTTINTNQNAKESNYASDFINYRNLLSLYNFAHSDEIDVFGFFEYAVLPYVKFTPATYWHNDVTNAIISLTTDSATEIWEFVKNGPQKNVPNRTGHTRYPKRGEIQYTEYKNLVDRFKTDLNTLITFINTEGNPILKDQLGYDLTFKLELEEEPVYKGKRLSRESFTLSEQKFIRPKFYIKLSIPEYEGERDVVYRPHSFLNEAKLTAIGLALRLAVLKKSLETGNPKLKILVLDDLLISLDMSNREKVLALIFDDYLSTHQLLILTHDKVFFEFVKLFIKQKSNLSDWKISEMYRGIDPAGVPYPVIIPGEFGYYDKAKRYFEAHDYTASALYIRKSLEKIVYDRIQEEITRVIDGKPNNLQFLWERLLERYQSLGHKISDNIIKSFEQTKLMLLNPQAHHDLSTPVYKLELEKAIKLINDIENTCPIPTTMILLSKGMTMQYKHPDIAHNYSIDFELLTDFRTDGLLGNTTTVFPRCRIISWQYNGTAFWDFRRSIAAKPGKPIEHRLDQIKGTLTDMAMVPLGITDDMFLDNTILTNGIWSLREIINKSGAVI
ncbi:RecF/RecN/SMC N terminal domain-containing protein [Filimonas lacunae]|uniref:RecF/RecN/SMC N terminal domain-containing protein n=1 Tax=Filimonas lacunae TaxID=477680 RepID=A0A173MID8_9BACT|nr:ATP-binding protein [Filimonas lacunae]BAV07384.1 hypothetical protein FLA_3407 [Filimonas lacunae]SIT30581.1 RecF/RecN/SMC N terminal domain-containing protein [Filimonas lacunae]